MHLFLHFLWFFLICFSVGYDNVCWICCKYLNTFETIAHGHEIRDVIVSSIVSFNLISEENCIRILIPTQYFDKLFGKSFLSQKLPFT
jgi:hypothetical protein